jgi:hypothetical protein
MTAVGDLSINDGVESFGKSAETLVDGLPLGCREVDTVVYLVP